FSVSMKTLLGRSIVDLAKDLGGEASPTPILVSLGLLVPDEVDFANLPGTVLDDDPDALRNSHRHLNPTVAKGPDHTRPNGSAKRSTVAKISSKSRSHGMRVGHSTRRG